MSSKKANEPEQPAQGTKQTDADDSELGQKPTSQPDDDGPRNPADSPYAG